MDAPISRTLTVSEHALDEVLEELACRVRIRPSVRRRWWRSPQVTITGPAQAVESAEAAITEIEDRVWLDQQL